MESMEVHNQLNIPRRRRLQTDAWKVESNTWNEKVHVVQDSVNAFIEGKEGIQIHIIMEVKRRKATISEGYLLVQ